MNRIVASIADCGGHHDLSRPGDGADPLPRDGSHDFDFSRGAWHKHATQMLDPFAGGTPTVTLDGTKTAQAIWGGRGWIEEIEAERRRRLQSAAS